MSDVAATESAVVPSEQQGGGGRRVIAVICVILAILLTTPSALAYWGQRTLNDTQRYLDTVGPLVDSPEVQDAIATTVTNAIQKQVDVEALLNEAFAGVTQDRPRLQLLVGPIAGAVNGLIEREVNDFIASDTFADLWITANARAQQALTRLLKGDESGAITLQGDEVVLDVGDVIDQVKERLVARGLTFVENAPIPDVDKQIVLLEAPQLKQLRTIYAFSNPVAQWLIVVVAALYLAAFVLSRHRPRMAGIIGVGLLGNALLVGFALSVGRQLFINELSGTVFGPASSVFYDTLLLTSSVAGTSSPGSVSSWWPPVGSLGPTPRVPLLVRRCVVAWRAVARAFPQKVQWGGPLGQGQRLLGALRRVGARCRGPDVGQQCLAVAAAVVNRGRSRGTGGSPSTRWSGLRGIGCRSRSRRVGRRGRSARRLGLVGVPSVVDIEDDHAEVLVVDPVADSVLASARPPQPFEGCAQRNPDNPRSSAEWPADELPRREGRRWRKRLRECSTCPRREDDGVRRIVWGLTCHDARARRSSISADMSAAVVTSPAATAASAARSRSIAASSRSNSMVASRDSRSSAESRRHTPGRFESRGRVRASGRPRRRSPTGVP